MSIEVTDGGRKFFLKTEHTMYEIKADEYGVLQHVWYGARTECDMEYLLDFPDVGFSGNLYEAGNRRNYSLDTLPLEYACGGGGDFRLPAAEAVHADGSRILDLRFESYRVQKGKYALRGLPFVRADGDGADTLEIYLRDTCWNVQVVLRYGVLEKADVITRCAVFRNLGSAPYMLERADSLCLDLPCGEWEWIHFQGRHTMERGAERGKLVHGIQESSSRRGNSSHQQNPAVILCAGDCTEESGECLGALLMYSGSFETKIERTQLEQVRLVMGINAETFRWEVAPDGEFCTPEAVLSFSDRGLTELSHRFHAVIAEHVVAERWRTAERPVLINNWESTYFDFDEEKLLKIAEEAARLGVDLFVLDDGWFGNRNDDTSGLGDWFVNEKKLAGGLTRLAERVKALGMKFGIWVEPEMVNEDSDLYRAHPEWALSVPGRKPTRSRYQLALDLTRKEVVDYLFDALSELLGSAEISYVKWDMNRCLCDLYTPALPPSRQGETGHRYMLGLYELLERLTSAFPDVLFEGCCGGGGRFDAGMLFYCPQIWCSDNTDAYDRTLIQYGTSFFYPVSTMGAHVSAVPNHQTGRITPLEARAVVAMSGSFGYELDLNLLSQGEKDAVGEQIRRFRKYRPLIAGGKYYRLSDPLGGNLAVWSYVSRDRSEALVHGIVFRAQSNVLKYRVRLRGLDPEKRYAEEESGTVYTGKALSEGGVLLPRPQGDYFPFELHFKEIT